MESHSEQFGERVYSRGELQITKLSDRNYRTWKIEMKWLLRSKGLWDIVSKDVNPGENATEQERKAFATNDNRAIATIGLSIEPAQQIHIEDSTTAHEAWKSLEQVHQPKSRVRILQLKRELHHLQMKPDESMSSYISRAKIVANNLMEAGAEVKDEDFAYVLLAGLPDSYENLNMALASLPDDKFTSSEIKRVLLAEHDRRASRQEGEGSSTHKEAFHMSKRVDMRERKVPNFSKTRNVTCFNCRKPGHIARDCRTKVEKDRKKFEHKSRSNNDAFLISMNHVDVENVWILDSGSTHHVCKRKDWFSSFQEINTQVINTAADQNRPGSILHAKGVGSVTLKTYVGRETKGVTLNNVYFVPNLRKNLMSVSQIEKRNKELIFKEGKATIRNTVMNEVMCEAHRRNDLYIVNAEVQMPFKDTVEANNLNIQDEAIWHQRFCHINNDAIKELSKKDQVIGLNQTKLDKYTCDACNIAKATKRPCKTLKVRQTKEVGELIHSDVCGPLPVPSIGGSRYFITFTDDYSRTVSVKCIKTKDQVKEIIKDFITKMERQTGKRVKRFRTDNGLEYCNKELTTYFKSLGIKHERSNVETPQMNGVAERVNRSLLNLTRAMLKSSGLPQKFWAEAVTTASYAKNRTGHSATKGEVPLAIMTSRKPSVRHLKVYGCLAYARLPNQGRKKLDDRATECIFVGYASQTRGYRLWCPLKQDVITTKHVRFAEDKMGYEWIYKKDAENYRHNQIWVHDDEEEDNIEKVTDVHTENIIQREETIEEEPVIQAKARGRPKKVVRNPYGRKGKPRTQENQTNPPSEVESSDWRDSDIEANIVEIIEPRSLNEALESPQANEWKEAIEDELNSLERRKTWEVTKLPRGRKCVGCRWVFKIKTNTEGEVIRYRARLVAKGFSQQRGIDYSETYTPVANFSLIRLFLALTVNFRWHTRHIDIKCAYLYGELEEEIFMKPPPLYKTEEGTVVKLLRPIYGLKQSGRNWNKALNEFLVDQGFERLRSSSCVYKRNDWTIIIVYVDDIFIFAPDLDSITDTVKRIKGKFEANDLGEISQALGVKVERNSEGDIRLSQRLYVEDVLKKYNMTECRKAATPLDPGIRLSKEDAPKTEEEKKSMDKVPYRELIGSLMFLALYTRPDILFAVTKLSQYNSNPGKQHWHQAKHILRYLSATKDYSIVYKTDINPKVEIYCDADWAGDTDDRHSFSGMVMLLGSSIVQWKAVKQKSLSTSTMEAEYVSVANGVKETQWLNMLLSELNLIDYFPGPLQINCDNKSAIDFAHNNMEKSKTKHIDISYHIVREKLEEGLIQLSYVPSNENLADGMTKALKKIAHDRFVKTLDMGFTRCGN